MAGHSTKARAILVVQFCSEGCFAYRHGSQSTTRQNIHLISEVKASAQDSFAAHCEAQTAKAILNESSGELLAKQTTIFIIFVAIFQHEFANEKGWYRSAYLIANNSYT